MHIYASACVRGACESLLATPAVHFDAQVCHTLTQTHTNSRHANLHYLVLTTNGRQYSNMPKPERNQTNKNISEALSRTEGIFVIDVSAAANGRRASGGGEHGSPGGAADGSPGTPDTQQLWRVVAIQQPTLADARWMLARAQRRQSERDATP